MNQNQEPSFSPMDPRDFGNVVATLIRGGSPIAAIAAIGGYAVEKYVEMKSKKNGGFKELDE